MVPPVNRWLPPPTPPTAACATWMKQQLYGVFSSCGSKTERERKEGEKVLRFRHEPSGFTVQRALPGRAQGTKGRGLWHCCQLPRLSGTLLCWASF